MATIVNTLRVYNAFYLVVDSDPAAGAGTPAGVNSLAVTQNGSVYQKTGILDTDWTLVVAASSVNQAVFNSSGNFTVPAGVTRLKIWGRPGAGGGAGGQGGGGGASSDGMFTVAGQAQFGGNGGAAGNGGNGNNAGVGGTGSTGGAGVAGLNGAGGGGGGGAGGGGSGTTGGAGGVGGAGGKGSDGAVVIEYVVGV